MENKFDWPAVFPEQCPPPTAKQVDAILYRLIEGDQPSASDFISGRILQPKRRFSDECDAHGLSVLLSVEDAQKLRKAIPGFQERKIAYGNISENDGVLLHTPSKKSRGHHTWWVPIGVEAERLFSLCREVGEIHESGL